MIVVLFTTSYPYDYATEQTFLKGEIEILRKRFERVILIPRIAQGNLLSVPNNKVEVDTSFAEDFTLLKRIFLGILSLFSKDFYHDIKNHFPASLSPSYLRKLVSFLSGAYITKKWVMDWLKENKTSASSAIFYTYWFDEVTMGIGMAKNKYSDLKLISRVHGYDLYEELYGIWHCRQKSISLLDGLFADSDIGTNYLQKKYPQFENKYETALLGVSDPKGISQPSKDGVLRIVSCSILNPVKRIDLLLDGIVYAAKMRENQKIEWSHFGDGDTRQDYINRVSSEFPCNVKVEFPGYQTQNELIQTYLNHPIDIFVNVSSTEGTPVSIMEAISCGIPVIATAVGGNVEIVSEKNGFLLSENPTPQEIAETLLRVCDQTDEMLKKRQGSREVWLQRYNEATNFEAFAQKLVEIRKR